MKRAAAVAAGLVGLRRSFLPTTTTTTTFSSMPAFSWLRQPATDEEQKPVRPPWLLLPRTEEDEANDICRLYSIRDRSPLISRLPQGLRWVCCLGSSHGWLVILDPSFTPHLLNPLSSSRLPLPSINTLSLPCIPPSSALSPIVPTLPAEADSFLDHDFHPPSTSSHFRMERRVSRNSITTKEGIPYDDGTTIVTDRGLYFGKTVVDLRFPSNSYTPPSIPCDYTAIAIYGRHKELAMARAGDRSWKPVNTQHCLFQDVIHHKGWFYAVNEVGSVEGIDPNCNSPQWTDLFRGPVNMRREPGKRYLVESLGELFLVNRLVARGFSPDGRDSGNAGYRTTGFEVFKLGESMSYWIRVNSLGDQALFLGSNHSVSLSACEFPELKGNCIYFTDDDWENSLLFEGAGPRDFGVFNLGDGRTEPLSPLDLVPDTAAPPIWVIPLVDDHKSVHAELPPLLSVMATH